MPASLELQGVLSIQRSLRNLPSDYQLLIKERYHRILPMLQLLLHPRDILERNRAWPGIRPKGKAATRYLALKWARQARSAIQTYAAQYGENADELWQLCRAYFRHGPIGLIDVLPSLLPPLIPD